MPEKKKMGRPLEENPKDIKVTIRLDSMTMQKLNKLCKEKKLSKSELIRQLINAN